MRRKRLVRWVLLLVLAGAGGGYRLVWGGPDPVLHTTSIGAGAYLAALDGWRGRLYLGDLALGGGYVLSTSTGAVISPTGTSRLGSFELADAQVPQAVAVGSDDTITIVDDRGATPLISATPLVTLPDYVDGSLQYWFLDEPTDMFYNLDQNGEMTIVDVRSGASFPVPVCTGGKANLVESHRERHLFLPCGGGSTEMYDARSGLLLATINTTNLGTCPCTRLADDATDRVFLAGSQALDVLDARTGSLLRTLAIGAWAGGTLAIDAHAGGSLVLDSRSGNVVAADVGSGKAPGAVLLLDGRSGVVLERWSVPAHPVSLLVNPLTGHLLVASVGPTDRAGNPLGDGQISVLDLDHGTTLQRVAVGLLPGALLADRRQAHLFVLNYTERMDGTALTRSYADGGWAHLLRSLKGWFGWLPWASPKRPPPPTEVTVMMLDLRGL